MNSRTKKKIDSRQILPYVVIVLFMIVTIGHVAEYAGSFESGNWWILGIFYALAVDASIVICSWFTRWATTKTWAWTGYVTFTLASGILNVAQVQPWSQGSFWLCFGAWVYSLFPTASIALLGFLARDAKLLVERSDRSKSKAKQSQPVEQIEQKHSGKDNGHKPALCPHCERSFGSVQAVSAHLRFCDAKESELVPQQ